MERRLVAVVAREFFTTSRILAVFLILFAAGQATAANEARVTRVSKEVKLASPSGASHKAVINEPVSDGTEVRTGMDAQAEILFNNQTLARLGDKTTFAFNRGVRQMDLRTGAMLVRAPKSARGAEVRIAGATVAVTGTTCLIEHNAGRYMKLVVLDGTARIFLKAKLGESVLVKEGQLLMFHLSPKLTSLPNPVDVDIKRLMATSHLVRGFPPIGSEHSIEKGIADQNKEKTKGGLVETNLVIFGRGTAVSLVPASSATPEPSPSSSPQPQPDDR
jgi:hypothetical protein